MDAIIKSRPHAHRSIVLRKRRPEECVEQRQDQPAGPSPSKPETAAEASGGSPPFAFHEMKRELAETERKEKVAAWKTKVEKRKMLMDSDKNEVLKRFKMLLTVVESGLILGLQSCIIKNVNYEIAGLINVEIPLDTQYMEMSVSFLNAKRSNVPPNYSQLQTIQLSGFQKLDKIKDANRRSRQLEELTDKMRECKRLIKEFERVAKQEETRNPQDKNRMLNERKQSMIKELNSYVALKKQHASENKRIDLFDGPGGDGFGEENVQLASSMTNQQLMDHGNHMMDETDQTIDRAKKVVEETINVGAETAASLKAQTEQMSRIVNELDSIQFSIKKASKLVKEIGRQVATDRCIMAMLFLIVMGVIAIIIVKVGAVTLIANDTCSPSCSLSKPLHSLPIVDSHCEFPEHEADQAKYSSLLLVLIVHQANEEYL
ncbi:hypothetical protein ZIOFF_053807 [Zingiber officinale]|uniref:t-SNARE coiled-coil homology domain-containing protein n=1 Tax=Zingiber officinale TaxID=94328 RepID=A0A8J5FGM6_ZINOF|nr:hypothetical protein ZIOFF_053807 [Zingiber officinale]